MVKKTGWKTKFVIGMLLILVASASVSGFSISGYKINNSDGSGISGWNITIMNETIWSITTSTNATGYYEVNDLVNGNYTVSEELRPDWTNVSPSTQNITSAGENISVNFSNAPIDYTYNVSGYKINNSDSTGMSGWNITISNLTMGSSILTDNTGFYKFENLLNGTYIITEELQSDWTNVTPLSREIIISGQDKQNENFTNQQIIHTYTISGYKINGSDGSGLSNWNITLRNSTMQISTLTGVTGSYNFPNLLNGTYTVSEALKPDWTNTTPLSQDITISGQDRLNLNFTNRPVIHTYTISGYKINESDGSGLSNWNITLRNSTIQISTLTGVTGSYNFPNLLNGTYTVSEALKPDWTNTTPLSQDITISGQDRLNLNFTNRPVIHTYTISGYKINESDGSGLSNWNITLRNSTIQISTLTGITGSYNFPNLLNGTYTVSEALKPDWTNTTPLSQDITISGQDVSVTFRNQPVIHTYNVSGYKINASDGSGLSNWNITLRNSTMQISTLTGVTGSYNFPNLLNGTYTVFEELKPEWTNVTPASQNIMIQGQDTANLNFTNKPPLVIVSDDFSAPTLNTSLWTIINPRNDATFSIVGAGTRNAFLNISIPRGLDHDVWIVNNAPRIMQNASNIDFEVEVKFESQMNTRYQIQGVIIQQDINKYIRSDIYNDGYNTKIFAATFANGAPGQVFDTIINSGPSAVPLYLRVKRTGDLWTQRYSLDGINWIPGATFTYILKVTSVGPFVGNSGYPITNSPATTGLIDYFFNTNSPIVPEDTLPAGSKVSISGFKINASDGTGIKDWNITIKNSTMQTSTLTDINGYYNFTNVSTGKYTVTEEIRSEWMNVTPSSQEIEVIYGDILNVNFTNQPKVHTYNVSGYKINNSDITGIANWNITISNTTTQITRSTDINGFYNFTNLKNGTYNVTEEKRSGWTNVTPISREITISGQNILNVNFTNQPTLKYRISGFKINASDSHGVANWNITISNITTQLTRLTDINGFYEFANLDQDTYTVSEEMRSEWTNVTPSSLNITISGVDITNVNFTNQQIIHTYNLSGFKINASDGRGISGWNITIKNSTIQTSKFTDPNGLYEFTNLVNDTYTVFEEQSSNWTNVSPASQNITISGQEKQNVNFTNKPVVIISDDFSSPTLNPIWTFINPRNDATISLVGTGTRDAFLNISIPRGIDHDVWILNNAPRIMQKAPNKDFEIEVKFQSQLNSQYQLEGVIIQQDLDKYIRSDIYNDGYSTRIFAATFANGLPGEVFDTMINTGPGSNLSMRVKRTGDLWTQSYSTDGINWIQGATFTFALKVTSIGPFIGNSGYPIANSPAFAGLIDYFFNTNSPIIPEDQMKFNVSGFKINANDGSGIANWNITIRNSTMQTSKFTDTNGFYEFNNLLNGNYTVTEEMQSGWMNVTPISREVIVASQNIVNTNFTNQPPPTVIVSDDFSAPTLNTSLWTKIDPLNDSTFIFVGTGTKNALLSIAVPGGIVHDIWGGTNNAPRIMQNASNIDFEIEVKFQSQLASQYQMQGLIIQQDSNNYTRFNFESNGYDTKIFAGNFTNGLSTIRVYNIISSSPSANPMYMRVKRVGDQWTQNYSYDGATWTTGVIFTHAMNVTSVGPFIGNKGLVSPAYTGLIDYFFNTNSPIIPEDPVKFNVSGFKINASDSRGIANWNITIRNSTMQMSRLTDSNGFYNFTNLLNGTYTVFEELQSEWTNLTPASQEITISGQNILNLNFTNQPKVKTFKISGYKINANDGSGIANWNITMRNSTTVISRLTDSNGFYNFLNLVNGTYNITEELQTAWTNITPVSQNIIISGQDASNVNFTNRPLVTYNVSGFKINASSGRGISGWNITINNSIIRTSKFTDSNGFYEFTLPANGTYTVFEEARSEWMNVSPASQIITISGNNRLNVNFTNQPIIHRYNVSGFKINASDGRGISGWNITIKNSTIQTSKLTDPNGLYEFTNLVNGTYTVFEEVQSDWMNVTPVSQEITVSGQNKLNQNFTNKPVVIISDDFSAPTLNTSIWTVIDPRNDSTISLVGTGTRDAFLSIAVPGGLVHDIWNGNKNAPMIMQKAPDKDFEIEVNFSSHPTSDTQAQGVIIQRDMNKYIRFDFQSDGYSTKIFSGTYDNGTITVKNLSIINGSRNLYMRVKRVGDQWTQNYSYDGTNWNTGAIFTYPMKVTTVGLFAGNSGYTPPAYTGLIDYFFNTNSPIVPEDAPPAGSKFNISGFKINASDSRGIANWNITLKNSTMQTSTLTDSNGSYNFTNVPTGKYTVSEEMRSYWTNVTPFSQEIGLYEDIQNVNFTNRPIARTFNVSGYKINASDSRGIANWNITLKNTTMQISRLTDSNGFYNFTNLVNGTYTISEELKPEWMNVTPLSQDRTILGNDEKNINFTNRQIIHTYNLSGFKINNLDGTVIANWNITISNSTMAISRLTDSNGFYNFTNLTNGTYTVTEEIRPGWKNITSASQQILVAGQDKQNVNFINTPLGVVSDDFSASNLNTLLWTKINPLNDASFAIEGTGSSDAVLNITIPAGTTHDVNDAGNNAARIMQSVIVTDFGVEAKFQSVLNKTYQMQGIIIEQDGLNFLRFDFFSFNGIIYIYAANFNGGISSTINMINIGTSNNTAKNMYMRVNRAGNHWTQNYSFDGSNWTTAASFDRTLAVTSVGPFAGNVENGASPAPAFSCLIDYVFNTQSPLVPEDPVRSNVSGFKIYDTNQNGIWDAGESGIPNWKISLINYNTGIEIANTTTDSSGQYAFNYIPGGTYRVTEEMKPGYIATNSTSVAISVSNIDIKNLNFTNYLPVFAPNITTQPADQTVKFNQTVTFNVVVEGTPPLSYQWQKNGVNISGATGSSYATPLTTMSDNRATFRVGVTNPVGSNTSNSATLTVKNIVSDDFNSTSLNTAIWTVVDNGATVSQVGGTLNILVPGGSSHDAWNGVNTVARVMQSAANTDFEVELKFISPMLSQYQTQGLIVQQDANNYLRFDFVKDSANTRIFAASITNSIATPRSDITITAGNPLYLRVNRTANQWRQSYSYDGITWTPAANFIQALSVTSIGPYAGNADGASSPVFISRIDYFFNTSSPIIPGPQGYKISGFKIDDTNGNGSWNSGEQGIPNWKISLFNNTTGIEIANTLTGANGGYTFANLLNGTYNVTEATNPGYIATGSVSRVATIQGIDVTNLNFTNKELRNNISGFNINDTNDNGVWDSGEQGISNWKIYLRNYTTGIEIANITTGIDGAYSFGNLRTDTYTVQEETKVGYTATNGTSKVISISGQDVRNQNFTNNNVLKGVIITTHPGNQNVKLGKNATFSVLATGTAPLSYQWQKNSVNITGATSSSYTTIPTTMLDNGATFRVVVNNSVNSTISNSAMITVMNIVSDDFNNQTLNTDIWTPVNPKNDAIFSTIGTGTPDALLSIALPAGVAHDAYTGGNFAPRIMQAASNTDFEVEAKFQSQMTTQYQMQGIIVQQDNKNYLRFDFVKFTGNTNVYALSITNDVATQKLGLTITQGNPLYLRINRTGNQWTENYSYDGTTWMTAGKFTQVLNVTSVGPFVGNMGEPESSSPAFTGLIDYFFNTSSIISDDTPDTTPPNIAIWYGNSQRFGFLGVPQTWVNILGNVNDSSRIDSLNYSLNGGSAQNLNVGPDGIRLQSKGDFNIEIDRANFNCGNNQIVIKAQDPYGNMNSSTVSVDYSCNNVWPRPYFINWSTVTNITDAAQIVDGLWTKEPNSIRPAILGYDRVVDMGEMTWDNYEISAPITLNTPIDTTIPWVNVGMIMGWQGHGNDGKQPREKWWPLGAFGLYTYDTNMKDMRLGIFGALNGELNTIAYDPSGMHLEVGIPYIFKMRAQNVTNNTLYSLKVWRQGTTEPSNWTVSGYGFPGELKKGSAVLMTHYVNASFGNVSINPINDTTPPVISNVISEVYENSATIRWTTDKLASSNVSYGLSAAYGNGSVVDGAMVMSHAVSLTSLMPGILYHFKINSTDASGHSSSTADLNFTTKLLLPPSITTQPLNRTVAVGQTATFSVVANGTAPLTYQWQKNGLNISGATSTSYTTPKANLTDNGTKYKVVVTNNISSITSNEVNLTVTDDQLPPFRVAANVNAAGYERSEKPVEVSVNFTQLLNALGQTAGLNENSIRVAETDNNGAVLNPVVSFQFDKTPDYNAATKATGTIVFIMDGTTPANTERYYQICFDIPGKSYSPLYVEPQVTLTDNIQDEGQSSYQIAAAGSTYFFQKEGGGFSSLLDASGNDWIGYHPGGGSGGEYRGIPNSYPGTFHPGFTCCTSTIVSQGPIKISVRTVTKDGKFEDLWNFYPGYATMNAVKASNYYYWLYEGTPGGTLDPNSDFMVRSDGTLNLLSNSWSTDIRVNEWAYFSDPAVNRSFFVSHTEDDYWLDTYWPMEGNMTVFGFGRDDPPATRFLSDAPQHFTMGLINGTGFDQNSRIVNSAYRDLTITIESQPIIVTQPVNQNVWMGQSATFSVTAQGKAPLSYQWRKDGTDISGATGPSYTTPATSSTNSSSYSVVVTNSLGSVTSESALMSVSSALLILDTNTTITGGFSYFDLPSGLPYDLTSPVNYAQGTLYQRIEVITKPSLKNVSFQYCAFQDQIVSAKHVCSNEAKLRFSSPGTYYGNQSMTSMFQYNNISWVRPLIRNGQMLVVKDGNGYPVDLGNPEWATMWDGTPELTLYYPMQVHYTAIIVPPGEPSPWGGEPGIATAPVNQTVTLGGTATFSVTATGATPFSYQWQKNGTNITGATGTTYTTPATIQADNGAMFRVIVSNARGSVTSTNATLTVTLPIAPGIVTQPLNQTVTVGQTAIFSVIANGTAPLTYQWQKNGSIIPGATGATYTTPATIQADNGSTFRVNVSNTMGSVVSINATLTLIPPTPVSITTQPLNQTVTVGQTATFGVVATGSAPLTYQWQKNGTIIAGATGASYTTPITTLLDNGSTFRVNVTNPAGSVISNNATLTVMNATSILKNPGFESGTANWIFYSDVAGNSFSASSPGYAGSNALKVVLNNSLGANMQLYQDGVTLEPNTQYRLTFAAYSTNGHDMLVNLIRPSSPPVQYGLYQVINLSTNWQTFTTVFTTSGFTGTVSDGRFRFWFVGYPTNGEAYYFDDIQLVKV